MKNSNNTIHVCAVKNNHTLPKAILTELAHVRPKQNIEYIDSKIQPFENGELLPDILTSVRKKDIVLISTVEENINIEVVKVQLYLDALRRAGAHSIQLIMPFFYYARQDKTGGQRQPISGSMFASIYEMLGINHFITVHLHNEAIQGFFQCQADLIGTKKIFWEHLKEYQNEQEGYFDPLEWLIVFPDEGGAKQCRQFVSKSGAAGYAGFSKYRTSANKVETMDFLGDVRGKRCLLYDDIIDTGGTLAKAGGLLMENGAKEVIGAGTHALLNGNASEVLQNAPFTKIFVTDSLYIPERKYFPKMEVISLAPMLAKIIIKAHNGESIRSENW